MGVPVEFEGATGKLWCQQCIVDTPFGLQEGVICPGGPALMPVSLLARAGGSFMVTSAGDSVLEAEGAFPQTFV